MADVEKKLNSSQKKYIAILGIFASVALAFTGGLSFSSSVLDNIQKASIYRTVFLVLAIGLVLIDIIFILFYYIDRIVKDKEKFNFIPMIIANTIIVLLLVGVLVAWYNGFVENRNEQIEQAVLYISSQIQTYKI